MSKQFFFVFSFYFLLQERAKPIHPPYLLPLPPRTNLNPILPPPNPPHPLPPRTNSNPLHPSLNPHPPPTHPPSSVLSASSSSGSFILGISDSVSLLIHWAQLINDVSHIFTSYGRGIWGVINVVLLHFVKVFKTRTINDICSSWRFKTRQMCPVCEAKKEITLHYSLLQRSTRMKWVHVCITGIFVRLCTCTVMESSSSFIRVRWSWDSRILRLTHLHM